MPRLRKPLKIRVTERKLGREKSFGMSWQGMRWVEIDPRQTSKEYLDTLIHEALHELLPQHSEEWVTNAATTLSRLIWRMGFRRLASK